MYDSADVTSRPVRVTQEVEDHLSVERVEAIMVESATWVYDKGFPEPSYPRVCALPLSAFKFTFNLLLT